MNTLCPQLAYWSFVPHFTLGVMLTWYYSPLSGVRQRESKLLLLVGCASSDKNLLGVGHRLAVFSYVVAWQVLLPATVTEKGLDVCNHSGFLAFNFCKLVS